MVVVREVDHLPDLRRAFLGRLRHRVHVRARVQVQVRRLVRAGPGVLVHGDVSRRGRLARVRPGVVRHQRRRHGRRVRVLRGALDHELHHGDGLRLLAGVAGVRGRGVVAEDDRRAGGRLREVDDDVGDLGRRHDEPLGRYRPGEVHRVGRDVHEAEPRGERQPEEARVAGVEDAEAVAAAAHAEVRPRLAVDDDDCAEVLRVPLRVHAGVVARAVHEERPVGGAEVAVEQHEVPVERLPAGQVHRAFLGGAGDAVRAHEPREDVDAREAHGVVVVPQVPGRLPVRVRVGRRREARARSGEPAGEPGQRVAVGGGLLHAAVQVDHGGDAAAAGRHGGRQRGVPREEVARREVVRPRHVRGDAPHGLDGGARHRGGLLAGSVGEDTRRRKVAVEFLTQIM
uniref:Uncharacterized protein n=1 Tax=Zea mays TaxID=4577 RepID=A0A804N0M0_MAIZE